LSAAGIAVLGLLAAVSTALVWLAVNASFGFASRTSTGLDGSPDSSAATYQHYEVRSGDYPSTVTLRETDQYEEGVMPGAADVRLLNISPSERTATFSVTLELDLSSVYQLVRDPYTDGKPHPTQLGSLHETSWGNAEDFSIAILPCVLPPAISCYSYEVHFPFDETLRYGPKGLAAQYVTKTVTVPIAAHPERYPSDTYTISLAPSFIQLPVDIEVAHVCQPVNGIMTCEQPADTSDVSYALPVDYTVGAGPALASERSTVIVNKDPSDGRISDLTFVVSRPQGAQVFAYTLAALPAILALCVLPLWWRIAATHQRSHELGSVLTGVGLALAIVPLRTVLVPSTFSGELVLTRIDYILGLDVLFIGDIVGLAVARGLLRAAANAFRAMED
jgi:hypothetical protein